IWQYKMSLVSPVVKWIFWAISSSDKLLSCW
ncbi:MAG: hypothetical protein MRERV_94c001, partial [Mycoplasmataceae bacterium RV_VA103A]